MHHPKYEETFLEANKDKHFGLDYFPYPTPEYIQEICIDYYEQRTEMKLGLIDEAIKRNLEFDWQK